MRRRALPAILFLVTGATVAIAAWVLGYVHIRNLTQPFTRLEALSSSVVVYSYAKVAVMSHVDGSTLPLCRTIDAKLAQGWEVTFLKCPAVVEIRADCVAIDGRQYRGEDGKRVSITIFENGSVLTGTRIGSADRVEWWMHLFYPDSWLREMWERPE